MYIYNIYAGGPKSYVDSGIPTLVTEYAAAPIPLVTRVTTRRPLVRRSRAAGKVPVVTRVTISRRMDVICT